ncbi:GNAT family N-acetyltransferase [Dehalogenimonas alkenigignens]|uniref:N-acetylglutamate synthase or related acetyltransferase n=1 Tax=Dehalogenimonas alkenigignens TaxID=1217799 RepID=A0A0W0GIS8_9CHLR|nr:GNAT family N-acetyltransferase [Dehalogenimonas alkenigignens]KTB48479.1 N-acetylglutamate synthase or related acetyltransferase [Dehalogenimonas alkenigignens]PVV85071.1 N-acetyltransferase [Dehalogenimonas alkenigignens]
MAVDSSSIIALAETEALVILDIINAAAKRYGGIIQPDCYHEPYMSGDVLACEMTSMTFYGYLQDGKVVGVAGFQPVAGVTLIRHAYILPANQRQGIGSKLMEYLKSLTRTRSLLVGTWAAAYWAIDFYQKYGFKLLPDRTELLARYWRISPRQIETSVVLGMELDVK